MDDDCTPEMVEAMGGRPLSHGGRRAVWRALGRVTLWALVVLLALLALNALVAGLGYGSF